MSDDFRDTVIIGSSTLYPLAKGAIQMLILLFIYYYLMITICKWQHQKKQNCEPGELQRFFFSWGGLGGSPIW